MKKIFAIFRKKISCSLILGVFLFFSNNYSFAVSNFPSYGIIYNSSNVSNQKIALGINPTANLNASSGITKNGKNGSVGIAYNLTTTMAQTLGMSSSGWYDATSPLSPCEGWGVSAKDTYGTYKSGYVGGADPNCGGAKTVGGVTSNISNISLKNFVVDTTSILSTVWISDSAGNPMLEVTHRYSPSLERPDELFQGEVTISNISGGQLTDIRYRRTMDWDPPPAGNGETYAMVTHHGVKTSVSLPASQYPRVLYAGNNGWGSGDPMALDYMASGYTNSSIFFNQDFVRNGLTANQSISQLSSRGSSFIFQFGDLSCGQSVSFLMYYGASNVLGDITSGQGILGALSAVGVEVYSIGESSTTKKNAPVISYPYAFGFKGVSGTAIPPSIAAKTAILPLGISTNPNCIQTYSPPLLSGSHLYQSNFFYRKNSDSAYNVKNNPECGTNIPLYSGQWMGDISRYDLDSNGNPIASSVISAASLLNTRAASKNVSFSAGGRSIWTVGNNPVCNSPMLSEPADYNNFTLTNSNALGSMLFNCAPPSTTAVQDLINFVRGLDSYWEGNLTQSDVRPAVLADIFHSEMTMIGPPSAPYTSDNTLSKTEAYYRGQNNYSNFVSLNANRRKQMYVGANDGMLHAFDENLNERWAFVPPSVVSHLREMVAIKGTGPNLGTSNTVFNVDGPIAYKDIYLNSSGKWMTILIGGLGYGGNGYYALDVTDPDHPHHLFTLENDTTNKLVSYWDSSGTKTTYPYNSAPNNINYSQLGKAWSRPVIMLLPYAQGSIYQKWVAVFGGGYSGGANTTLGSNVFILDLDANSGASPSSSGGQIIANINVPLDTSSDIVNGVPSHLTVVTEDGTTMADYYGGIAYFTDLQGQLWKMNLSKKSLADPNSSFLGLVRAFKTESSQANDRYAFNMLATTVVQGAASNTNNTVVNKVYNYFGTGDITHLQRRVGSINNRIYGVQDSDFPSASLTNSNQTVINFTNVNTNSCSVTNSWYADVWAKTGTSSADDYQKIVGRAAIYNKNIYFSAYKPGLSCGSGTSALIEIADGCVANLMSNPSKGIATVPVIDSKGNIYVGLSNVPKNGASINSIIKVNSSAYNKASQVKYRSWREKHN